MGTHTASLLDCPELQILLLCARTRLGADEARRLHARLGHSPDWDGLRRLARQHRLLPLLARHLEAAPPGAVPGPVQALLRTARHAAALREQVLTRELTALLALLAAQGIPALPYKGPAFAAQAYGDAALRPCSDLDLLVRPADVLRVKALLIARGYLSQHCFAGPAEEAAHLRTDCEYNFVRPSDRMLVEVHWRLRPQSFPFPLDVETLWNRRETLALPNASVPTLPLADYLILLCVHGAKHRWERLLWVCDIAQIVRADPALPWTAITRQAETLGCRRVLSLGLLLARDLLEAPVPADVLAETPPAVARLAAQVRQTYAAPEAVHGLAPMLFHVGVRERLKDKIPYVTSRLRREASRWRRRILTTSEVVPCSSPHKQKGGE